MSTMAWCASYAGEVDNIMTYAAFNDCLVELRVAVAADAGKLRAKRHFGKDERGWAAFPDVSAALKDASIIVH